MSMCAVIPRARSTFFPALARTTPLSRKSIKMSSSQAGQAPNFKGLHERQPSSEEKAFLDDVLQLYQLKPISSAYAHYDQKAVFHDPIGIAEGLDKIKAQFNAMPSIFSRSDTKAVKVLDNPEIEYHFKPAGSKLVDSLITFHVDPSTNLILRHDEEWDGQKNADASDGFMGKLAEMRKKFTAAAVDAVTDSRPADQK